jgi:hypothetical protein
LNDDDDPPLYTAITNSVGLAHRDMLSVILSSLLLLVLAVPALFLIFRLEPLPGIPHDQTPNYALFGDIPALTAFMKTNKSPQLFMQAQAEKLGAICQLLLGRTRLIMVSDAQEIEDMYAKRKTFERPSVTIDMRVDFFATISLGILAKPIFKQV